MAPKQKEVVLRGLSVSKGIGIGFPFFFHSENEESTENFEKKEVESEIARYRSAVNSSRKDLEDLKKRSIRECPPEVVSILGIHLEMMEDPLITNTVEKKIRESDQNTEEIVQKLIDEYKYKFSCLKDDFFQERVGDIVDVSQRILGHLRPHAKNRISELPHNSIILSKELVPSQTVEASLSFVSAFVTSSGGITSHTAIIARAKGIPYVTNVDLDQLKETQPHSLIVDGTQGLVIVNPSLRTLKKYQALKATYSRDYKMLESSAHLKGETMDGFEVRIFANLEDPKEIHSVKKNGAVGVGLFRSEYLCLSEKRLLTEEEQFQIYKKMAKSLHGQPIVIRTLDIGGEKQIKEPTNVDAKFFNDLKSELNPSLGCRAIRWLLRYPEIFESQLRAILRASAFGEIHILVPMITDVSEIREVCKMIVTLRENLQKEGHRVAKDIPIGCMIEVPSAALLADAIAKEVDFMSIGTNDLTQYVLAADRSNPLTSELYFSPHPSLLRLIRMIVNAANAARKPVILCGEMAADASLIPLLIGLGIREFSVSPRLIPIVKHTIRKWRILDACQLAEEALELDSGQELKEYLAAKNSEIES